MSEQNIKYTLTQILSCKESNIVMPKELQQYCSHKKKYDISLLEDLTPIMEQISKSYNSGIDPNDVILRNSIRENLNKLNSKNYDKVLQDIKTLNYTNDTHFTFLATELIIKCMNDVMASKTNDVINNQKIPTELYIDIAYIFSGYCTYTKNNEEIKFKIIMSKLCQQYFNKFINKEERMDKNNPHRVIIYKGFMNMMGMLYIKEIFPIDIIFVCMNKIINLILSTTVPREDRDNYFSGYERLINRILYYFETMPSKISEFNKIRQQLYTINDRITQACKEQTKPIERFSIITHTENNERFEALNKLCG